MHGCFLSSALVVSGLQEAKGKAGRSSKAKGAKKTPSHVDNAFAFLAGACEVGELGPAGGDAWHFSLAKPKRKPEQDDASEDDGEEAWEARPHDRRTEDRKSSGTEESVLTNICTHMQCITVPVCTFVCQRLLRDLAQLKTSNRLRWMQDREGLQQVLQLLFVFTSGIT